MLYLIVTADDFGKDCETNRAVSIAKEEGILTSASLMVVGKRWEEAVEIAKEKDIDVGLHLSLTEGESIYLRKYINWSPSQLGIKIQFFKDKRLYAKNEIELQCKRFISTGLSLRHIEPHHHIHIHPVIRKMVIRSCVKYNIKGIRIPHEPWQISAPILKRHMLRNIFYRIVFSLLNAQLRKEAIKNSLIFTDAVFGLYSTGETTEDFIILLLERIRKMGINKGTFELYLHPVDKKTSSSFSELKALTSEKVRKKIEELDIKLISFSDLIATRV